MANCVSGAKPRRAASLFDMRFRQIDDGSRHTRRLRRLPSQSALRQAPVRRPDTARSTAHLVENRLTAIAPSSNQLSVRGRLSIAPAFQRVGVRGVRWSPTASTARERFPRLASQSDTRRSVRAARCRITGAEFYVNGGRIPSPRRGTTITRDPSSGESVAPVPLRARERRGIRDADGGVPHLQTSVTLWRLHLHPRVLFGLRFSRSDSVRSAASTRSP